MIRRSLLVAVLTYRRPAALERGLATVLEHVSALERDLGRAISPSVVVIDNDPDESARTTVMSFDSNLVRYVTEPKPGIAAGRNRALAEASRHDLLVFIDDDEEPQERWLEPLIDTWRHTQPAAVMGRVVSKFETPLDPWIDAGSFFRRRRLPTGTVIPVAATNNLLLDMHQVRAAGTLFDDTFGLTGGEDTLFTKLLVRAGGTIVWCDESVATDCVPPDRATRGWVLRRAWSHGNSATLVEIHSADSAVQRAVIRVVSGLRGLLRIGGGSLRFGVGMLSASSRHQARGLRAACRGAGMLVGAFGLAYREYGREPRVRRWPLRTRAAGVRR
ncbi:glycosyltransferase family 2 protein [Arthrobacter oryzae]|uniref:Glycosyltransferase n=1 Tax=Arthrobacter oryzae TaxID=409290 RepID=A0A3N0BZW0_9MICC|nr:glycosyltransferase [Arthrobacter oryzae]RNL55434.1 glycosyltransferase [Arthrobacter oryzae]